MALTDPVSDPGGRFWYIPAQGLIMDVMIGEHWKQMPKYQTWTFMFLNEKVGNPVSTVLDCLGYTSKK